MLQKSFLAYITIWFLFQLLIEINCQITPFKPKQRYAHTATLINDKLYILGGSAVDGSNTVGKDFFYLDVSVKFDTAQNSLWQDLTNINTVPSHFSAASAKGGANNNTLILYGGFNSTEMELVYTFDPQSNSWSTPKVTGTREAYLVGITNSHGKMYLWGGISEVGVDANNMFILDTINLSLEKGSLIGAPTSSQNYGAVLLPNNNIIYMGGYNMDQNIEIALNLTYIYDTNNDRWITQATTGTIPSARKGFSAVLGLDGQRIIIFGGNSTNNKITSDNSLYVLDLIDFEWTTPKVTGKVPNSRMYHKANVIGKYMVISFGGGYDQSNESDVLLLDISNDKEYIWTNNFDPSINSASSVDKPLNNNISTMIAIIIGSMLGGILLTLGTVLLYKWNKNRQTQNDIVLIMPRSEDQENNLPVISIGKTRFSIANNVL